MFFFLFYIVTTVCGFQFQKDGVDIKYKISSFKTCVDIPASSRLTPIAEVSLTDCVSHCTFSKNCMGLVYRRQYRLCERYGKGNVIEKNGSCVHIKRDDIDVSVIFSRCFHTLLIISFWK